MDIKNLNVSFFYGTTSLMLDVKAKKKIHNLVTICHQLKRKTALWECEDYLSSEKIYIYLQESLVQWLLIVQKDIGFRVYYKP